MLYQKPFDQSDPNASYVNGNPSSGTAGSIPPAAAFEQPMREIVNAITQSGLTPSNGDLTQLWQAIKNAVQIGAPPLSLIHTGTSAGTATVITSDVTPSITTYVTGMTYVIGMTTACTGPATINLDGVGARQVLNLDGSALTAGAWAANQPIILTDDGTALRLMSGSSGQTLINSFLASGARARFKTQYTIGDVAIDGSAANNYQTYQSGYTDLGTFTVPAGYVCIDLNATYFLLGPTTTGLTTFLGIFGNANDGSGWFLIESNRADKPAGQTITLSRPGLLSLDASKSYTFSARIVKDVSGGAATAASGNLLGLAFKF